MSHVQILLFSQNMMGLERTVVVFIYWYQREKYIMLRIVI